MKKYCAIVCKTFIASKTILQQFAKHLHRHNSSNTRSSVKHIVYRSAVTRVNEGREQKHWNCLDCFQTEAEWPELTRLRKEGQLGTETFLKTVITVDEEISGL